MANFVFLDTETTGLDDDAELVEIAVVDATGAVLFESYCRPTVPVDPGARPFTASGRRSWQRHRHGRRLRSGCGRRWKAKPW